MLINLKGLNCAVCAGKIEKEILRLDGVETAEINLITQKIKLKPSVKTDEKILFDKIKFIVNKYEPDVEIYLESISDENSAVKCETARCEDFLKAVKPSFVVAVFLFISSIFFKGNASKYLAVASYLLASHDLFISVFKNFSFLKSIDEKFLMTVSTLGAIYVGEYREACMVIIFYKFGEYLQDLAIDNSRKSIKSLEKIRPSFANVSVEGEIIKVAPNELRLRDEIIIKPYETVPTDCVVRQGQSYVDNSMISGESSKVHVSSGDKLYSGSINGNGLLRAEVTSIYENSTVSKIFRMVESAQSKKSVAEKFITKFAKIYTPIICFMGVAVALVPPLLLDEPFKVWIYRAMTILVISCPCSLVISIPMAYFSSIGAASKQGILVKGGNEIDKLRKIKTVIFDKTGTLTDGKFILEKVVSVSDYDDEFVRRMLFTLEMYSSHPFARGITDAINCIEPFKITKIEEIPGMGVSARFHGKTVLAGSEKLLNGNGVNIDKKIDGSCVYLSLGKKLIAYAVLHDRIKEGTYESLKELRNYVEKIFIFSGDKKEPVDFVANTLKADDYYSEMLPEDKLRNLERIMEEREGLVSFVGDGINDAPVIMRSDLGISMGSMGSDAAVEASDIVIMDDDIAKINRGIEISKMCFRIIMENLIFILAVKVSVIILGTFGIAKIWEAIFADVGVCLLSVLNSGRILSRFGSKSYIRKGGLH